MAKSRPPYLPAFRPQMVELVRTGRPPEELARALHETQALHCPLNRGNSTCGWHRIATGCEILLDYVIDETEWSRGRSPAATAGPTRPAAKSSPGSSP